ncbi:MAG TPA: hypothetical protein VFS20_31460 [Longimicrobium sp.]|nr:hypothetical protein [Longimicrobium sp.]
MATRKSSSTADDELAAAIQAAAAAGERFVEAKSELEHRLADIDTALLELVQRVYDSTPSEYQRTFRVSEDGGGDEDLSLPDFIRYLLERPRGTSASFTIEVTENLYDTSGGDDDDEDTDDDLGF